ncbi:hypothetical protein ACWCPS_07155 [Streptomyces mauvecolor]
MGRRVGPRAGWLACHRPGLRRLDGRRGARRSARGRRCARAAGPAGGHAGASLHYLLGPSDASFDPLAPQALRNLVPDLAEHDVYLCGPGPMADAATASLIKAGVPEQRIHTEQFGF